MTEKCSVFEMVNVDDIQLDMANPRIAKWVEMYGDEISAEQMGLALGAADSQSDPSNTTFYSLRESIKTNEGLIHPIIVNRQADGLLVVIEGNTRTLIYREFKNQGVPGDWSKIPAMVYEKLRQEQIDGIRLQAHLVGPRPWDPYSKAKYLDHLRNSEHLTLNQIVDFCGGRKKEVLDYITGYQDMETHYRPLLESDDEFDPSRFSAFVELQRTRVKETLVNTKSTKGDFSKWVRDGLLSPLNTVRQLPRILENPKAKEIFLRDGAQEAVKVLDVPSPDDALKDASLDHLAREVCRRVLSMSYSELQRLREDVGSDQNEVLCQARDQLTQLCADIVSDE